LTVGGAADIGAVTQPRFSRLRGSTQISRARRLFAEIPECAELGYLRYLAALETLNTMRFDEARTMAREIQALATAHGDPTLCAMALVLEGIATVRSGQVTDGLAFVTRRCCPSVPATSNGAGQATCTAS
jgi:hypothetical protein